MDREERRRLTRKTRDFFDALAPRWGGIMGDGHAERLRALLSPVLFDGARRVLDVGAGSGVLWPILRDRLGGAALLAAVDLSAAMLKQGPTDAAAPLVADGEELPFGDGAFDWVFCNSCFPHFTDQGAALAEMRRVLAPGGTLVVCHSESRAAINEIHRQTGGQVGGHELPEDEAMVLLARGAGLTPSLLLDGKQGYLFLAERA